MASDPAVAHPLLGSPGVRRSPMGKLETWGVECASTSLGSEGTGIRILALTPIPTPTPTRIPKSMVSQQILRC